MRTVIFIPPLPRITGGMAVLLRIAEHMHASGQAVYLALREANATLQAALPPHLPCLAWDDMRLTADDCWLTPEGWPNALLAGLQAKARCVVYVQNWAYFLSNMPDNTFWHQLPVRFIAVSEPVRQFIHYSSGMDAPLLRPAIDPALFYPPQRDTAAPENGPLRIAYMPRKNPALARQIRETVNARLHHSATVSSSLEWYEIHHKSPQEVANILRNCHIFLATGFPEGCPLPPLEALASGCIVTGFAGMGGWDYMRQAAPRALYAANAPWFPLRPVPWAGNGFYAADADIMGASCALEDACTLLRHGGPNLSAVRHAAAQTAAAYSPQHQAATIADLWQHWL